MANKKILKSKEKFFTDIKIKDNENRWNYIKAINEFNGTNNIITLICNGCKTETKRTPVKHLTEFQPCKYKCFTINKIDETSYNKLNIINNQEIDIQNIIEEWKIIPDNINYSISNYGNCKNNKTNIKINGYTYSSGYSSVKLNKKHYSLHVLVATLFIPNPENKISVNHKNKIRNDNRVANLEWSTMSEQNIHKNTKTKHYNDNINGTPILRLNKDNDEIIEEYSSLMLASKWILNNIYNINTDSIDIDKKLKSMSTSLSIKINYSKNKIRFLHGYNWKFKDIINVIENELWKNINITELNLYQISTFGRFKNLKGKNKDKFTDHNGYCEIKINDKHYSIHRLVAITFIPNPENKPIVNHIDSNKKNNNVKNLEWCNMSENISHAYNTGNHSSATKIVQYDKDKVKIKEFNSINEASRQLNIWASTISRLCRKKYSKTNLYNNLYYFEYI